MGALVELDILASRRKLTAWRSAPSEVTLRSKVVMIYVIATIEVEAGKRDAFLAAFLANVPNVLAEEGCIEYEPTIDVSSGIAVQGAVRDEVVTIVEKWESLQALRAHLAAPHMLEYREQVKELVKRVDLQILEPAPAP